MPYLPQSEKEKQAQGQQQTGQPPVLSSASSAPISTSGAAGGAPTKSGSWTNLQDYLNANQQQGAQMGQKAAGLVTGQAEQARQGLQSGVQQFQQQAASALPQYNKDQMTQQFQQASAMKPEDIARYQQQLTASYKGPQSIEGQTGYDAILKSITNTQNKAAQTSTEGGRKQLLSEAYKRPQYTQGEKKLDQLIVQGNKGAQEAFGGARGTYDALAKQQQEAIKSTQDIAAQKQAEASKIQQETKGAVTGAKQGAYTAAQSKAAEINAQRQKEYNDVIAKVNQRAADQEAAYMANPNVTNPNWQSTWRQAGQYIKPGEQITQEQAMSPEDRANLLALTKITGGTGDLINEQDYQTASGQQSLGQGAYLAPGSQQALSEINFLNPEYQDQFFRQNFGIGY